MNSSEPVLPPGENPEPPPASTTPQMHRNRSLWWRITGITAFYLGIPLLLLAIALPNFVKARTTRARDGCSASLKQIDGAIRQWALENRKTAKDTVTLNDVASFLKGGVPPNCPSGGIYHVSTVESGPVCSLMFMRAVYYGHTITTCGDPEKDYRGLDPSLQKVLAGEYEQWKQKPEQQRQLEAERWKREKEWDQRTQWQQWKPAVMPVFVPGVLFFGLYLARLRRCLREFRSQSTE